MNDKNMLGDFIYQLRKEKCLSQSKLGELVGVSNKAVSKWETNEANPEIGNIKRLAAALGVSADELLACKKEEKGAPTQNGKVRETERGYLKTTRRSVEYTSKKKTAKGTPYVHINFGLGENGAVLKAKGIVAIGLISKGIVSMGILSIGIVSLGVLTVGLVAFGSIAIGLLLSLGGIALGLGVSVGGIAVGTIAVGGIAIGVFSVGGLSVGLYAHTGEFGKAIGLYRYYH